MKQLTAFILCVNLLVLCAFTSIHNIKPKLMPYPKTEKRPVIEDYFGEKITDNYRWLEDDKSPETENWVKTENEVSFDYLQSIPYRNTIKQQLEDIWNYEKITTPFKEGRFTYFYKNDGLQNQFVLYRKEGAAKEEVFLDPNTFSKDGTTSLGQIVFTKDGSLAAYSISEGGSDWRKIIVLKTDNKEIIGDTLKDIKFSGISWKGNEGFFYSSYDKPEGSELSAKTDEHKLYYHKLGTPQKEDELIFGGIPAQKYRYISGQVTEDGHFLIVSAANTTSGNKLFVQDLTKKHAPFITLIDNFAYDTNFLDFKDNTFFFITNLQAPNKRVIALDMKDLQNRPRFRELIKETENVLSVSTGGGYIFAKYMVDAISKIVQYDYTGKFLREITLPGMGTASGFSGKVEDKELYFSFQNYITPASYYKINPEEGSYELYWKPSIHFNADDYESKQIFYESKDGTKIPMMITYKKGLSLDGTHPTILYGYGGFNISLTPTFSAINTVWLRNGGIYAVPNLRGGGEYGKKWHEAGIRLKKQNVFDDFIAAAEYLIAQKYTSSDKLAIMGRSNGGLLVGATMTQRPDLIKVALPGVGVLDMLRYHTFTAGAGWAYDYGTAEQSKEIFTYLRAYSPVHNVKAGVQYPATLITTGDHDDRVVPAHSFKFAAELQEKQNGNNPILIRIETNAGHGAGTPVTKLVEQWADIFGFTFWNCGITHLEK